MSNLLRWLIKSQTPALKLALSLFASAFLLLFVQDYDVAFSQSGELGLGSNTTNMTSPISGSSEPLSGFVSKGTINTVIDVPNGKWLAAGNWSMIVNNGNVTSFDTKMTWHNSSGTNAHTHDLTNFKSVSGESQLSTNVSDKQTIIKGMSDVSSNGKVSWSEVPTTIAINDGKIISIAVDDTKTNRHFGGQSLLGIVDSFVPCSDVPGPNMELLPPCTQVPSEETGFGFVNDSLAFGPSQDFSQGFPDQGQGFPSEDFSQGFPDQGQGFPSEDFSQGFPDQGQGFPSEDFSQGFPDQGQGFPSEDDQIDNTNDEESRPEISPECEGLEMENITASGFESDPTDYHPPSDAFDGESSTWWSNNDIDPWLEIDLGQTQKICGVTVQWNKGDSREYTFEIEVSEDGNDYEKVFEGNNNKGSTEPETYAFEEEINGKFIRLTTTDTSSGDGWVSVQEFGALGMPLQ